MDTDTIADALDVLESLPRWRLPAPRWEQVRLHLDRIAAGLDRADDAGLAEAVADLRLCAPTRIDPIKGKSGAPDEILDRVAPLVHSLKQPRPLPKPEKDQAAGDPKPR